MMYDLLESEKKKKNPELHLFEVHMVSKVNFEKKCFELSEEILQLFETKMFLPLAKKEDSTIKIYVFPAQPTC